MIMGIKKLLKESYEPSDLIDLKDSSFVKEVSEHQERFMKDMEMAVVEAVDVDEQFSELIKSGVVDLTNLHITYQAYKLLVK